MWIYFEQVDENEKLKHTLFEEIATKRKIQIIIGTLLMIFLFGFIIFGYVIAVQFKASLLKNL